MKRQKNEKAVNLLFFFFLTFYAMLSHHTLAAILPEIVFLFWPCTCIGDGMHVKISTVGPREKERERKNTFIKPKYDVVNETNNLTQNHPKSKREEDWIKHIENSRKSLDPYNERAHRQTGRVCLLSTNWAGSGQMDDNLPFSHSTAGRAYVCVCECESVFVRTTNA